MAARKAANLEMVRLLRAAFPPQEFTTILATRAVGWLASRGPTRIDELAEAVHPLLGYGWMYNQQELTAADVRRSLAGLASLLLALDQIEVDWPMWRTGPAARSFFTSATLLEPVLGERAG